MGLKLNHDACAAAGKFPIHGEQVGAAPVDQAISLAGNGFLLWPFTSYGFSPEYAMPAGQIGG